VAGEVDGEGGLAEGDDRVVPRVRVQAGAVQEHDARRRIAVSDGAERASVRQGEREAAGGGRGAALCRGLLGQEGELVERGACGTLLGSLGCAGHGSSSDGKVVGTCPLSRATGLDRKSQITPHESVVKYLPVWLNLSASAWQCEFPTFRRFAQ
jgi:hypothetical protein